MISALRDRWRAASASYPPAEAFGAAAADLIGTSGEWPNPFIPSGAAEL